MEDDDTFYDFMSAREFNGYLETSPDRGERRDTGFVIVRWRPENSGDISIGDMPDIPE